MKNKLSYFILLINIAFFTHCFTADPKIVTKGVYSSNEITKVSVKWENSEGDSIQSNTGLRAYQITDPSDFQYIMNDPNNVMYKTLESITLEKISEDFNSYDIFLITTNYNKDQSSTIDFDRCKIYSEENKDPDFLSYINYDYVWVKEYLGGIAGSQRGIRLKRELFSLFEFMQKKNEITGNSDITHIPSKRIVTAFKKKALNKSLVIQTEKFTAKFHF